jgi:diguanylate cyclase (GGDEF)-like protein
MLPSCPPIVGRRDVTDRNKGEEQAHYQARHDALTGLANYREFMDRLEQEVRRADRSQHPFAVLLPDVDGLKGINDLHGHLAGNRALQRLAAVMNEHCRSTDLAVGYGGDEFAVMLMDADKGMAEQVAQRIEREWTARRSASAAHRRKHRLRHLPRRRQDRCCTHRGRRPATLQMQEDRK